MSVEAANSPPAEQGDRLLWLAAGALGLLAVTWLLISQPWSSPDLDVTVDDEPSSVVTATEPARTPVDGTDALQAADLDNPLRMAALAFEAGMLVEPEDYSAWTLYARALAADADNEAARAGLESVAEELIKRAGVALEQGRFDDATASVERILGVLSEHAPALELRRAIAASIPEPAPRVAAPSPQPAVETPRQARNVAPAEVEAAARQAPPKIDRVPEHHTAFELAMRENRLLTPPDDNAKAHVEAMLAENSEHELTIGAQSLLVDELLSRSKQALEALDTEASRSWIDAAESIGADPGDVALARVRLDDQIIALESSKPLPASSLRVIEYVPPEYPPRALSRSIEGWVDVEFVVMTDGSTRDVVATDVSHDRYFEDEAVDAVSQWRFEPRAFNGRLIEQRSYTRIRFDLQQ